VKIRHGEAIARDEPLALERLHPIHPGATWIFEVRITEGPHQPAGRAPVRTYFERKTIRVVNEVGGNPYGWTGSSRCRGASPESCEPVPDSSSFVARLGDALIEGEVPEADTLIPSRTRDDPAETGVWIFRHVDEIRVPAGRFRGCVELTHTPAKEWNASVARTVYCPDVGPVYRKAEHPGGGTAEDTLMRFFTDPAFAVKSASSPPSAAPASPEPPAAPASKVP
jgi:hypothetical protein